MAKTITNEGLRVGDLKRMVLNKISVDEFESNIDKDAIVIGFFVHDLSAARDLNRYIQKSASDFIDVEISPAPDQHGYFMVFIELLNDDTFPETVMSLIDEISPLVDVDPKQWHASIRKMGKHTLTLDILKKFISRNKISECIMDFCKKSKLSECSYDGKKIYMTGYGLRVEANVIDFDTTENVLKKNNLSEAHTYSSRETRELKIILGEGWTVTGIGNAMALEYMNDPRVLLLDL